jgi:hypothetical protein
MRLKNVTLAVKPVVLSNNLMFCRGCARFHRTHLKKSSVWKGTRKKLTNSLLKWAVSAGQFSNFVQPPFLFVSDHSETHRMKIMFFLHQIGLGQTVCLAHVIIGIYHGNNWHHAFAFTVEHM